MKMTYDPEVDVAYMQFVESIADGEAARSIVAVKETTADGPAELNVDLDADGRLLGIEILFASESLPPGTLAAFETLTDS